MWPILFELNVGETTTLSLGDRPFVVRLMSVQHFWEPDYWITDNPSHRTLRAAHIVVSVNGVEMTMAHRPYELPVTVGGLRLYVETTRLWAGAGAIANLGGVQKDVRFSAQLASKSWGPETLRFPIRNYRWRAATYQNTWSALVPYNVLYYHRGEDFGAIPDLLEVIPVLPGEVTASPVPTTRGSNVVVIKSMLNDDMPVFTVRYAHMNMETLDPTLVPGRVVHQGEVLGKTGCTWDGWHSQYADPHVHISFALEHTPVSPYPYLVEAYLRDYEDQVLAVAGGYYFINKGETLQLDARRSVVRDPHQSVRTFWHVHTGECVEGALVDVRYTVPGQYAEELVVITADGYEDRDYAEVRVYNPTSEVFVVAHGWAYSYPLRDLKPGQVVTFWNRLLHTEGPVRMDFGDGNIDEAVGESISHTFDKEGIYTVCLTATGHGGQPVMAKMRVVVG